MQAARVNGVHIHYAIDGPQNAPPIVFANSLGSDFRIWNGVADRLRSDFRLLRYDKRGHGLSDCTPAPYAMSDHVGDIAALMDHLGIRNAMIVGLSVGGMIAQGLLEARPDLVRSLVLCDTAHRIGNEAMWNERIEKVMSHGISALADSVLERWFPPAFRTERPAEFAIAANMLVRTPGEGYAGTCAALRDADYTGAAGRIDVPALLMVGSNDGSTPVELMRETQALIAGSRLEVIEGPGHLPCVEAPGIVAGLIAEFAAETGHA